MESTPSFAPLAARLAARADEIRPADGAEVSVANFMALFVCAILYMLIALCEALDARAAAAPAMREGAARPVAAVRPIAVRAPRLTLVRGVQAFAPKPGAALPGTGGPARSGPGLAWSRHPGPAWAVAGPPIAGLSNKSAFRAGFTHAQIVTIS